MCFLASPRSALYTIIGGTIRTKQTNEKETEMNIGLNMIIDAIDVAANDMGTVLYAAAGIVFLLALRMVKVSLNTAGHRARLR